MGRLTPAYLLQDAVVPRSKLPQIMREMVAIAARHRLLIANVFHAGDGNLHPMICYDDRDPDELARAKQANEELLHACIALGGSVTGEHGMGLDKAKNLPLQFAEADLNFMYRLRRVFDPDGMMNPGKLLPTHPACGEGFRPGAARLLPAGTLGVSVDRDRRAGRGARARAIVGRGDGATEPHRAGRGRGGRWSAALGGAAGRSLEQVAQRAGARPRRRARRPPAGQRQRSALGGPPPRADLVLDLRGLDAVLELQPDDLTVTVQAGVTAGALAARARPHRQRCPSIRPGGAAHARRHRAPPRPAGRSACATARCAICCSACASSRPTAWSPGAAPGWSSR